MSESLETYLSAALTRLEAAASGLMKEAGLTRETETIKILTELVKEQIRDENPHSSARPIG